MGYQRESGNKKKWKEVQEGETPEKDAKLKQLHEGEGMGEVEKMRKGKRCRNVGHQIKEGK
jgi:hypothetical protein